jgi:5-methylcytosine-specific restriction endonuclease McrA
MSALTLKAFVRYAKAHPGRYRTLTRGRPFTLSIEEGNIIFRPSSGRPFYPELEEYITAFNKLTSFRPGDYPNGLWSRSYFVTLVAAMFANKNTSPKHPPNALEKPELPSRKFERKVKQLRRRGTKVIPPGQATPERVGTTVEQFKRDPAVKAWVLEFARGRCELCDDKAPFVDRAGEPFLELHHVHPLGDDGSDTVTNAVALCPNCHRACHISRSRRQLTAKLYRHCARLLPPTVKFH